MGRSCGFLANPGRRSCPCPGTDGVEAQNVGAGAPDVSVDEGGHHCRSFARAVGQSMGAALTYSTNGPAPKGQWAPKSMN